jgi:glycosyltransferase involved in cell wall biosynthesis
MDAEEHPRISIVTPTLNQGRYIAATVHSVMDQGYPNLEYTIIDGGSTDSTHEVVSRLRKEYANAFEFESIKGMGQVAAINRGLAAATGKILAYINSDDVYLPGALWTVAHEFHFCPQAKWLAAPTIFFGEPPHEMRIVQRNRPPADRASWLLGNRMPQPSVFWTREVYREIGPFDEGYKYRFDHEYWLRFVDRGYTPIHLECPLSAYRLHGASFTCSQPDGFREELARLREQWRSKLSAREQQRLRGLIMQAEADRIHEEAMQSASAGATRQALGLWASGMRHAPAMFFKPVSYRRLRRVLFPRKSGKAQE